MKKIIKTTLYEFLNENQEYYTDLFIDYEKQPEELRNILDNFRLAGFGLFTGPN
jgi:hypothetical protein